MAASDYLFANSHAQRNITSIIYIVYRILWVYLLCNILYIVYFWIFLLRNVLHSIGIIYWRTFLRGLFFIDNFFTKHLRWLLLNFPFSKLRDSFYLKLDNHRKDLSNSKAMPAYNHSRKLVVRLKNNASVSVLQGEENLITLGGQIFFSLLIYNFFTLLLLKWENLDWEFPFFF